MKEKEKRLLANIKTKLPELETLLEEVSSHWVYEDSVYRFYHHSFKVYLICAEEEPFLFPFHEFLDFVMIAHKKKDDLVG